MFSDYKESGEECAVDSKKDHQRQSVLRAFADFRRFRAFHLSRHFFQPAVGIAESRAALKEFGFFRFIFTADWNYGESVFGAARPLLGSILTSVIAVGIAAPMGIGIAVFLTELCPSFLRGFFSTAVELLAAVPSIIYGMWGLFVFAPFLEKTVQKAAAASLGELPLIGSVFQVHYAGGIGLFTAGLTLSIMVLPFITGVAREALACVPKELKEAGYGLSAERWEVVRDVSLPYVRRSINGGVVIAAGRALGETMAIAYIIGNMNISLTSVFDPYVTVTSVLVNEFNEASGLQMSSLFLLALLLFVLNFSTLALAKLYILREK